MDAGDSEQGSPLPSVDVLKRRPECHGGNGPGAGLFTPGFLRHLLVFGRLNENLTHRHTHAAAAGDGRPRRRIPSESR